MGGYCDDTLEQFHYPPENAVEHLKEPFTIKLLIKLLKYISSGYLCSVDNYFMFGGIEPKVLNLLLFIVCIMLHFWYQTNQKRGFLLNFLHKCVK